MVSWLKSEYTLQAIIIELQVKHTNLYTEYLQTDVTFTILKVRCTCMIWITFLNRIIKNNLVLKIEYKYHHNEMKMFSAEKITITSKILEVILYTKHISK